MKCGLVAADGAVLHRETRPTPREAGGRAVLDALHRDRGRTRAEGRRRRSPGPRGRRRRTGHHRRRARHGRRREPRLGRYAGTRRTEGGHRRGPAGRARPRRPRRRLRGAPSGQRCSGTTNSLFLPLGTGIAAAMVVDGSLVQRRRLCRGARAHPVRPRGHRRALCLRPVGLPRDSGIRRRPGPPVRRTDRPDVWTEPARCSNCLLRVIPMQRRVWERRDGSSGRRAGPLHHAGRTDPDRDRRRSGRRR